MNIPGIKLNAAGDAILKYVGDDEDLLIDDPSVKAILMGAFEKAPKLRKITAPYITEVRLEAFKRCAHLERVDMPSVKYVGADSFSSCLELIDVCMPDLETIDSRAFYDCGKLNPDLNDFPKLRGIGYIALGRTAIEKADLSRVSLNEPVKFYGAFTRCEKLKEAILPDSLEEIPGSIFSGCCSLSKINWPKSLKKIGTTAFLGCESLTAFEPHDGLKSIGASAFKDCTELTKVVIPPSVDEMGARAFDSYGRVEGAVMYCSKRQAEKFDSTTEHWRGSDLVLPVITDADAMKRAIVAAKPFLVELCGAAREALEDELSLPFELDSMKFCIANQARVTLATTMAAKFSFAPVSNDKVKLSVQRVAEEASAKALTRDIKNKLPNDLADRVTKVGSAFFSESDDTITVTAYIKLGSGI